MKRMNLKNLMQVSMAVILGITIFGGLSSCSKKNDTTPSTQGRTAKFTITVNGATTNDVATIIVNSNGLNGSTSLWKVNGVVQSNQNVVNIPTTAFTGTTKTYVIESNTPLSGPIVADVACVSAGGNITLSFESEINGVVKENDQNVAVTPNAGYKHDFNY